MRYEPENRLVEKMQSGEYHWKEYIYHHSREMVTEYEDYCKRHNFNPKEEASAEKFIAMREKQFEEALQKGDA